MQITQRTVLGAFFITILVLASAAFATAKFCSRPHACDPPVGDPQLAQEGWRLAQPVAFENLTIFPVVTTQDADTSGFATLDEALASGEALITEQGAEMRRMRDGAFAPNYQASPQVNQLVLINRGKRPLVLLAGEVVSGGKQDRIIGKDRIVPIGSAPLPLDVFCVEHGRWTGDSMNFSAAETMVHPSVREKAAVEQDQVQVWAAVRDETPKVGQSESITSLPLSSRAYSSEAPVQAAAPAISQEAIGGVIAGAPSQSYRKIYQSPAVRGAVEDFANEISRRFDRANSGLKGGRVVGVVVAFGNDVAWSDVFASSQLFETYWPKLLRSYVVEALTRPAVREVATVDDARDFLRPATGHIQEETEPGVYLWRQQSVGNLTEIELEALAPKPVTLHWLRVARG